MENRPEKFWVECIKSFAGWVSEDGISNKVTKGEKLKAVLLKETGEYYAIDSKNEEIYIGEFDLDGTLCIDNKFKVLPESKGKFEYCYSID